MDEKTQAQVEQEMLELGKQVSEFLHTKGIHFIKLRFLSST